PGGDDGGEDGREVGVLRAVDGGPGRTGHVELTPCGLARRRRRQSLRLPGNGASDDNDEPTVGVDDNLVTP
ncbi:hypothetical protein ACN6K9_006206, partial [Streptomyces sp. SAS_267]